MPKGNWRVVPYHLMLSTKHGLLYARALKSNAPQFKTRKEACSWASRLSTTQSYMYVYLVVPRFRKVPEYLQQIGLGPSDIH